MAAEAVTRLAWWFQCEQCNIRYPFSRQSFAKDAAHVHNERYHREEAGG